MSEKLIPHEPSKVMVIRHVAPNIVTCSAPFLRYGRLKIGGRGTIGTLRHNSIVHGYANDFLFA